MLTFVFGVPGTGSGWILTPSNVPPKDNAGQEYLSTDKNSTFTRGQKSWFKKFDICGYYSCERR